MIKHIVITDGNRGSESLVVRKSKDILILSDSNTGIHTLSVRPEEGYFDSNMGIDSLCISIRRNIVLADSDTGVGGLSINNGNWARQAKLNSAFSSGSGFSGGFSSGAFSSGAFSSGFLGPPLAPQHSYIAPPRIWELFLSDQNTGQDSLSQPLPDGFSDGFSDGFEGRGLGCSTT